MKDSPKASIVRLPQPDFVVQRSGEYGSSVQVEDHGVNAVCVTISFAPLANLAAGLQVPKGQHGVARADGTVSVAAHAYAR
jgi:hypothetical protein